MNLDTLILAALAEDIGSGDITAHATIPADLQATAQIIAKQSGVLCGVDIAGQVFAAHDQKIHYTAQIRDGSAIATGTIVATLHGNARSLLTAERTALNFLQRLSGIATHTAHYVAQLAGTQAKLLDTRKTVPGWRALEKQAVQCGGGVNHRHGLYDRYLVKNNHVDLAGGMTQALQRLVAQRDPKIVLEVEVRNSAELDDTLPFHPDVILLDNFSVDDCRRAVAHIAGRAKIECSGGITLATIGAYAKTGVDYLSVGALTHSAPALDLHLRITRPASEPLAATPRTRA